MKKRMPVYNSQVSPLFVILLVFLLSGAVLGAFSGIYTPNLSISTALLEKANRSFIWCIIDVLKYNIILLIMSKFCGFLIPIHVAVRGFCLFFTVSAVYKDTVTFLDKTILLESILTNIVAIPCFLFIAVACFKIFMQKQKRQNKKLYAQVAFFLVINLLWNLICHFLF